MPTVRAILSLAPGFEIRDPCPVLKDSSNQRLQTKIKLFHGTRSTEHESRQFLLHVGDEVADVGAAIEQLVHPGHYSLARGVVAAGIERGVPFAEDGFKLRVHCAELFSKAFLRGGEAGAERGRVGIA